MTKREHVDEYAETQVLTDAEQAGLADDASAQTVYSEYVQELERMLKPEPRK